MKQQILAGLKEIEKLYGVRILYAVESGSRVWGFDSPDSDYDVRFVYVNPPAHYLGINEKADVIDNTPLNTKVLDFAGWDLRKTLQLFRKCNPPLLQWLRSPIEYIEGAYPIPEMRALVGKAFNPTAATYHYLNMAKGNYRTYLSEGPDVLTKKYFYVLHPLLACYYIEQRHSDPPITFDELQTFYLLQDDQYDYPVNDVEDLLRRKRAGVELGKGPLLPDINKWIEKRLAYFDKAALIRPRDQSEKLGALDHFFMNTVLQCSYSGAS